MAGLMALLLKRPWLEDTTPPRAGLCNFLSGASRSTGRAMTRVCKKIAAIGLPFYLAGGFGTHQQLHWALAQGAAGIQVGTAFAFCRESGIREDIKQQVIAMASSGRATVFTDPQASPTGFPFKVVALPPLAT